MMDDSNLIIKPCVGKSIGLQRVDIAETVLQMHVTFFYLWTYLVKKQIDLIDSLYHLCYQVIKHFCAQFNSENSTARQN